MADIQMNPGVAQEYATSIGNANDKLTIKNSVSFSGEVTVQGNSTAQTAFTSLTKSVNATQQMLQRDVTAIHSVVSSFEQADKRVKKEVEKLQIGGLK